MTFGSIITIILLAKSGGTLLWQEYQKGQQALLKNLGQAQSRTAKILSDALWKLVAHGTNNGIDSYELYRNLEKLLPLLCLDACHPQVADRVRARSADIIKTLGRGRLREQVALDNTAYAVNELMLLLLWDPECTEVFKATKVDAGKVDYLPNPSVGKEAFLESLEGVFDSAKEMHETQKKLADALQRYDSLLLISKDTTDAWLEVEELRVKLLALSTPARFDNLLRMVRTSYSNVRVAKNLATNWLPHLAYQRIRQGQHASTDCDFKEDPESSLGLLTDRFGHSQLLECRKREIAALFDAVGATDAERDDIELRIKILYAAVHQRWLKDGWIKQISSKWGMWDAIAPFSDLWFQAWRKTKYKRRRLFLEHYDTFQFKSPRQLTEEGVLGLVQTMEAHEDKVFVREGRLNSELQEIYNRVVENERHGKFDAAIADLKSLLRRVSEASGPNAVDYPDETLSAIHCYLACIYASRGEHLEEAVELAKQALEIQDSLLARLALGWSYHRQGEVAAIEELEVAKSAATRAGSGLLPLVHRVLGDAYRDAERPQDAEEAWREGWELADDPAWKDQAELTPFEVKERANLQKEIGERLGLL